MRLSLTILFVLLSLAGVASPWTDYVQLTVHERVARPGSHPRLFATTNDFARVRAATDELVVLGRERVMRTANEMRGFPLPRRVLEGRRLLAVSQRTLARILALSMAYRLTDDARYAQRAVEEAAAVCAFRDWNPEHFLDTAEMTLAVAIAYDWLYDVLTPEQRRNIRRGIVRHGLAERNGAPKSGGWVAAANNWGQVCHAGLMAGAVAVMDEEPVLAERIIVRSITSLPRPMEAFAPDGGFPEGPGQYWPYAMNFNVLAIDLAARVFGTDFGLCDLPGFAASVDYPDTMTGPTGLKFNYSDAGILPRQDLLARRESEPCCWWLARRFARPDTLVRFEIPRYRAYCRERIPEHPSPRRSLRRLFPLTLLWMDPPAAGTLQPRTPLCRLLDGPVPAVVQRTGWESEDWFVGLKGGSPRDPHGHMDGGSFVLDAKGVRWAVDLGSEDYNRMESAGRNLWNPGPKSDRWKIFRLGADSHNILRVNGADPFVAGRARCTFFTNAPVCEAAFDLSSLYPHARKVVRKGTLVPGGGYILHDTLEGLAPGDVVKWQMTTPARVKENEKNQLTLVRRGPDGDDVTLKMTASDRYARWFERDIASVQGPDESANPGLVQLSFEVSAPTNGVVDVAVRFE